MAIRAPDGANNAFEFSKTRIGRRLLWEGSKTKKIYQELIVHVIQRNSIKNEQQRDVVGIDH